MTGTSPTAVSFVLNGKAKKKVRPEKVAEILKVAKAHHYRQRSAAKALTLQRTFKLGLCEWGAPAGHPLVGQASHHALLNLAAHRIHQAGFGVAMIQLDADKPLVDIATSLTFEEVDGLAFVNVPAGPLDKLMFSLAQHELPAVSLGTALPESEAQAAWVAIDRGASFRLALEHLLGQGRRRIAVLDTDIPQVHLATKEAAYRAAMNDHGLEALPVRRPDRLTARGISEMTDALLTDEPELEAIIVTDNYFVTVVQLALGDRDIRVMGYGDSAFATFAEPAIPTLSLPVAQLVESGLDWLLKAVEEEAALPALQEWVVGELELP